MATATPRQTFADPYVPHPLQRRQHLDGLRVVGGTQAHPLPRSRMHQVSDLALADEPSWPPKPGCPWRGWRRCRTRALPRAADDSTAGPCAHLCRGPLGDELALGEDGDAVAHLLYLVQHDSTAGPCAHLCRGPGSSPAPRPCPPGPCRWSARPGTGVRGHRVGRRPTPGAASCPGSRCGSGFSRGRQGPPCSATRPTLSSCLFL